MSKAFWNFSKNSSDLVARPFPNKYKIHFQMATEQAMHFYLQTMIRQRANVDHWRRTLADSWGVM